MRILILLALFLPSSVLAQESFRVRLEPRPGTGATGTGSGTLTLDRFATDLEFSITVSGLGSGELGAHIHRPDGTIAFALPLGETKAGVWQGLGPLDLFQLRAEQMFVLVHTEENPQGELRGDIVLDTVARRTDSFGAVKAGFRSSADGEDPRP